MASTKSGCPVCSKPTDPKFKPFCSQRCRQVDLNRWLSGTYRIPGSERPGSDVEDKNQSESED
ncbi:DNA gyrase inhibitor YacG [Dongia deserti]|uniref:DNA gyrase inhibitor YacG n=1 Tax=Dongia deserti TaxID=2268030 RepID=UPI000E65C1A8|nr:DNA gyrase inhibitor YacG [Dongia deserti]